MTSVSSSASWHPAFRPDSIEDVNATGPEDPDPPNDVIARDSSLELSQTTQHELSHQSNYIGSTFEIEQNHVMNDTDCAASGGVSDDVQTKLGLPKSSEFVDDNCDTDDNVHQGLDEDRSLSSITEVAANTKHSSTMSFARTVSNDVNWGDEEEDEVDPEWNPQSSTDTFKFMAQTDRTNSFPQVPVRDILKESLPHSQAEQIMQEIEQEPRGFSTDEEENNRNRNSSPQIGTIGVTANRSQDLQHETSDWFPDYGHAYGNHSEEQLDLDEEARFEEGLPLVQHAELQNTQSSLLTSHEAFLDDGAGAEVDFFAQINNSAAVDEDTPAPPLERKSTMQVMHSMHYEPHRESQDFIEESNLEGSQSSLERAKGGGIAVSTSTVLSEVLGDPDAAIHMEPDNLAKLELDSVDGDLAARWKAALAGDEFLEDDDDELLPDDEGPEGAPVQHNALDPAVLFGDDDAGFLDDTNDQESTDQQTSQDIPKAVRSPNGHMKGFDALTSGVQVDRPSSSSRFAPTGINNLQTASSRSYAPSGPLLTDLSRTNTATSGISPYPSPTIANFQSPQGPRPDMPLKAQSYASMSKGGYSSPYDLPMEVIKPRKRASMQTMNRPASSLVNAPPRSASTFTQSHSPSTMNGSRPSPNDQISEQASSDKHRPPRVAQNSQSGFFEDLPLSARPKPAPRNVSSFASNQYPSMGSAPPPASISRPPYNGQPTQQFTTSPSEPGPALIAPERVSPYASLSGSDISAQSMTPRYSPAPPPVPPNQTGPPPIAQSRYSPAPPSSGRPQPPIYSASSASIPVLPHQPRTSSPLAHFERSSMSQNNVPHGPNLSFDRRSSSSGHETSLRSNFLPATQEVEEHEQISSGNRNQTLLNDHPQSQPPAPSQQAYSPISRNSPPSQRLATRVVSSPTKRSSSNYQPQLSQSGAMPSFMPPKRSHTQSPGVSNSAPSSNFSQADPYRRPASVENTSSQIGATGSTHVTVAPNSNRPCGFTQESSYVSPNDGRERDPLQRWRGGPLFAWGVGGTIVTSFPKDVPRYGMNSTVPSIIRSPGEVKIKNVKDIDPLQTRLATFPGPLKGKTKKKEVVAWLSSGIENLEQGASHLRSLSTLTHEDKRMEEQLLLWKILRILVEQDGVLEGTPVIEKAVRDVLSPGTEVNRVDNDPLYATGAELSGISRSSTTTIGGDPVEPAVVDELRKHLLRGDREKAVWQAVDKRLWAHAMLISNTVSRDLYKQVAQEFVQKEVKIIGDNIQSLAALYEVFAGNFEESVDELVPPSARAGFKMVSATDGTGPSKDAMDGLDRWRETLGLILSNRIVGDDQALTALGRLLSGYGRAEAAHICFLFARSQSMFGGLDDPQTNIVLVGSDQLRQPYDFDKELEPVLLSEVFEYGLSLANLSAVAVSSPHLTVYKLWHAKVLAEYGYRDKALLYCEAMASSITSQTRRPPYHHALLVAELDDLSKRLKQSPKDDSSSWISKPSIDKAKGSVWATFNKFVAGDDGEVIGSGSNGGSADDIGPFARIAGGTPTISRSPSNTDMYGLYTDSIGSQKGAMPIPTTGPSSRYAPGTNSGLYEPQSVSSYGSSPRRSMEERSSGEYQRLEPHRFTAQRSDQRPSSEPVNGPNDHVPQTSSSYTPQTSYIPFGSNGQLLEPISDLTARTPSPNSLQHPDSPNSPKPHPAPYGQETSSFHSPHIDNLPPSSNHELPPSSYEPLATSGYEPPTSGYVPTPYEPATLDDEPDSPLDTRPKKKSFMDDDDDFPMVKAATAVAQEKSKAEKDREADEAFRRAADADAQKAKEAASSKKGWGLTGWFGGAKKEADISSQPNKPIKAKLGEASSFIFDPELKRWVNKKAGAEQTEAKGATPPPPRASGPPRTSSVPPPASRKMMPPPSGPTSAPRTLMPPASQQRAVSENLTSSNPTQNDGPAAAAPLPAEVSALSTPPAMSRTASNGSTGPPSRPGTSMSNASDIDDLLGPAQPRKVRGAAKKKGRGYVDVMGDKAS